MIPRERFVEIGLDRRDSRPLERDSAESSRESSSSIITITSLVVARFVPSSVVVVVVVVARDGSVGGMVGQGGPACSA